jgi:hypothetical protein
MEIVSFSAGMLVGMILSFVGGWIAYVIVATAYQKGLKKARLNPYAPKTP